MGKPRELDRGGAETETMGSTKRPVPGKRGKKSRGNLRGQDVPGKVGLRSRVRGPWPNVFGTERRGVQRDRVGKG